MRNLLLFSIILLLSSCVTDKYLLSTEEFNNSEYSVSGWEVLKSDTLVIGKITSMESEIYKGHLVNEISISLMNVAEIDELEVMKYLHTRMPEVKIELNKDLILNE